MNTKHTPGPWTMAAPKGNLTAWAIESAMQHPVAWVAQTLADNRIDDANARLIAAAPELLAALEKCENVIGMARLQGKLSDNPFDPVNDALLAARAVLDKLR